MWHGVVLLTRFWGQNLFLEKTDFWVRGLQTKKVCLVRINRVVSDLACRQSGACCKVSGRRKRGTAHVPCFGSQGCFTARCLNYQCNIVAQCDISSQWASRYDKFVAWCEKSTKAWKRPAFVGCDHNYTLSQILLEAKDESQQENRDLRGASPKGSLAWISIELEGIE